jgi:hypothetical protein
METIYTSYTKKIQATTYYFVKKFMVFPELKGVPPVLESFGMHTDFDKACTIASVSDADIKKQLLQEIEGGGRQAKVIDLNEIGFAHQKAVGL